MSAIMTLMRFASRAPAVLSSPTRIVALPLPLLHREQRSVDVAATAGVARSPPRASRLVGAADQSPIAGSPSHAAPRDSESQQSQQSHVSQQPSPSSETAAGALSLTAAVLGRRRLSLSSAALDFVDTVSLSSVGSLGSWPCGSAPVEVGAFDALARGRRAPPVWVPSGGECASFVQPARAAPTASRRLHSLLASARRGVGAFESPDTRVAAVGARRFSTSVAAESTAEHPPSVTSKILACQRERAKLRREAPFLTVMPCEWTESKVKEFQDANVDFQVRACVASFPFFFFFSVS
jgi:hypothetical protein